MNVKKSISLVSAISALLLSLTIGCDFGDIGTISIPDSGLPPPAPGMERVVFDPSEPQQLRSDETGAEIELPADALVTEDGEPPTGQVIAQFGPALSSTSTPEDMPGGFDAIDAQGDEVILVSYGVITIDFADQAGNFLDLKAGETATITIPALLKGPDTVPLWWLDESDDVWREEGTAEFRVDAYVGEVSHFSSWNADGRCNQACVEGNLVDEEGEPVADHKMMATLFESGCSDFAEGALSGQVVETDADGAFRFDGLIRNSVYDLDTEDGSAGDVVVPDESRDCVSLGDVVTLSGLPARADGGSDAPINDAGTGDAGELSRDAGAADAATVERDAQTEVDAGVSRVDAGASDAGSVFTDGGSADSASVRPDARDEGDAGIDVFWPRTISYDMGSIGALLSRSYGYASDGEFFYWSFTLWEENRAEIWKMRLDGTDATLLVEESSRSIDSIVLDSAIIAFTSTVYSCAGDSCTSTNTRIEAVQTDGSGRQVLYSGFDEESGPPRWMVPYQGVLYWFEGAGINRVPLSGGSATLIEAVSEDLFAISESTLYYLGYPSIEAEDYGLVRHPLGGGTPTLIATGDFGIMQMHVEGGWLYATNCSNSPTLQRVSTSGGSFSTLAEMANCTPYLIEGSDLYYIDDNGNPAVMQTDGSGKTKLSDRQYSDTGLLIRHDNILTLVEPDEGELYQHLLAQ